MVLLTITPAIVQALETARDRAPAAFAQLQPPADPALDAAAPGNPISHRQLLALCTLLKQHHHHLAPQHALSQEDASHPRNTPTLADLLHHTTLYTPPRPAPPPKSPQYTALMARLRAAQEAQSYQRMLRPPPTRETFSQRFPAAAAAAAADDDDDHVSYDEVHRQIILIINILVSIVCVACFVWVAARHWSVGKRLGLSMGASVGVGVAEVAVYAGYVRKVNEAKTREKKRPEVKEIVQTWVLHKGAEETTHRLLHQNTIRRRPKGKHG
ncbi:hypothetical protein ACEQ8H_003607 [Pleosporales sp. CAS-2024a]